MNTNTTNPDSLKIYRELTYIETYDWDLYATCESKSNIEKLANSNKFLNLGNELINTNSIKRIFNKEVDEIDNALLQIADKNLRARVQKEVDERRRNWTRLNMGIYRNILNRLSQ